MMHQLLVLLMILLAATLVLLLVLVGGGGGSSSIFVSALSTTQVGVDRRTLFQETSAKLLSCTLSVVVPTATTPALAATATTEEQQEKIYIGCGCFWHLQHSIAVFERDELSRKGNQLTCKTGYAGGGGGGGGGDDDARQRVCYHNSKNIADYGALGYGEVVQVDVPTNRIMDLMNVYFKNFDPNTKDRRDPMDIGSEYRSILGLPGGTHHPLFAGIRKVARKAGGYNLMAGKGNSDPDTLGKQLIYVYDTNQFPFHQAEIYHQFHNDFQSLPYGSQYNNLANRALEDGRLHITGCPNDDR